MLDRSARRRRGAEATWSSATAWPTPSPASTSDRRSSVKDQAVVAVEAMEGTDETIAPRRAARRAGRRASSRWPSRSRTCASTCRSSALPTIDAMQDAGATAAVDRCRQDAGPRRRGVCRQRPMRRGVTVVGRPLRRAVHVADALRVGVDRRRAPRPASRADPGATLPGVDAGRRRRHQPPRAPPRSPAQHGTRRPLTDASAADRPGRRRDDRRRRPRRTSTLALPFLERRHPCAGREADDAARSPRPTT